jgi:pimeloyl-ACP methyl ester carboxylesterase
MESAQLSDPRGFDMSTVKTMTATAVVLLSITACGVLATKAMAGDNPTQTTTRRVNAVVQLQTPRALPGRMPELPRRPAATGALRAQAQGVRAEPAPLPESANLAAIEPTTCPPAAEAEGFPVVCGYVPVPLDWAHPDALGTIKIYFELYTHTGEGPAESAMLMNWGGPGSATAAYRFYAFYFFGQDLDTHDLLLIDDRGRGLSSTIDCSALQHGTAPFAQAEAECAAQLGLAASRYGTGEIAQDTDAVRAALGYDKVDYFGWSYGGADVEAYATRFGDHLRSIVLDAPVGTPGVYQFDFDRARSQAEPRAIRLQCLRSPTCAADHPFPDLELDALAWTVRNHPVEGDSYDAAGNPMHVRIDEEAMLGYLIDNPNGNFTNTGELLAAGSALRRGDPVPILRLGAESFFPLEEYDSGDPTGFSYGALLATWSADFKFPWDWSAPVSVRQEQYGTAVDALPSWYFHPFSKQAATNNLLFDFVLPELWWEIPTPPSSIAEHHARFPYVPTLVLSGDMDRRVPFEITTKVAALYPDSLFVKVAEAGHPALIWSSCAANLATEFIRTLKVKNKDLRCATTPDVVWPAVGRFPLLAHDARPADIDKPGKNKIAFDERKVVTVAVAAATDAMQRSTVGFSGSGVGLRGGTFSTDYGDFTTWTTTLTDCAFVDDVTVSGTVIWSPSSPAMLGNPGDGSFTADLAVTGMGTAGGTLHVEGKWQAQGPVGNFKITGTLGGKNVSALVPEA